MITERNTKRIKLSHRSENGAHTAILRAGSVVFGTYELVEQILIAHLARQNREAVCQVFVFQRISRTLQNVITTSPLVQQLLHLRPSERCLSSDRLMY